MNARKEDVFPATIGTWINQRLDIGVDGRADVNNHVMRVYHGPLRTYFLGTGDRWLGDPDEIVQGFFADRLDRDGFFDDWRSSGLPLRRWLINAFCFYLKELRRRRFRDGRTGGLPDDPVSFSGDPEAAVDRAFVVSVVQRALEQAKAECEKLGLSAHWAVFEQHHCRGRSYAELADEFGVQPPRAAVMARTATRKFRAILRDLLARDAVETDVDSEIRSLMERVG